MNIEDGAVFYSLLKTRNYIFWFIRTTLIYTYSSNSHLISSLFTLKQPGLKTNNRQIKNLNTPVISKVIKSIIKNFPQKKPPGQNDFTNEFYQILKKEYQPFTKSSKKYKRELIPSLFSQANIT